MKVISVKDPVAGLMYIQIDDEAVREVKAAALPRRVSTASIGSKAKDLVSELEKVSAVIAQVCDSIQSQVRATLKAAAPTELTLEFGIKLAGEAGIPLVTKGTAEGTFNVTAKWDFSK